MKEIIFIVLLIVFGCLNLFPQETLTGVSEEEYKFISEVLGGSENSLLVINNETIPARIVEKNLSKSHVSNGFYEEKTLKEMIPDLTDEIIKDFNSKNLKSHQVERKFTFAGKYELVNKWDLNNIFSSNGFEDLFKSWEDFYQKYPKSDGFIEFSRVGFDRDKKRAIIFTNHYCGVTCAEGSYAFYAKENNKWVVKTKVRLWAS